FPREAFITQTSGRPICGYPLNAIHPVRDQSVGDASATEASRSRGASATPASSAVFRNGFIPTPPCRSDPKRICLESGDQTGHQSFAGLLVSRDVAPLETSIVHTSRFPVLLSGCENATRVPSGEIRGCV